MSEIQEETSGAPRSSHSGFYSSNSPGSMPYNSIGGVPSVVHLGRRRKGRPSKPGKSSSSSPAHNRAASRALWRRQVIRRSHIGRELLRRDKLTESYHRLKNAIPSPGLCHVSRPRPSKMALLDSATTRINSLEKSRQQLLAKILEVEEEAARLRQANEALALSVVGQNLTVAPTSP